MRTSFGFSPSLPCFLCHIPPCLPISFPESLFRSPRGNEGSGNEIAYPRLSKVVEGLARFYNNSNVRSCLLSLNLPMNKEGRKRKVAIVTPPDVRSPRTPSPKRCREENGDDYESDDESEIGK